MGSRPTLGAEITKYIYLECVCVYVCEYGMYLFRPYMLIWGTGGPQRFMNHIKLYNLAEATFHLLNCKAGIHE